MSIRWLPRVVPFEGEPREPVPPDHFIRHATRSIAFMPEIWTSARVAEMVELFDGLAGGWQTRNRPGRLKPFVDAVNRGGVMRSGLAVELGSATGIATLALASWFPDLVAVDLSMEMLRLAPIEVPRLRADGACLPFADGAVDVLVLINMFLFPLEVERVLHPDGALVWISEGGPDTPIYLSPEEIEAALPGRWAIVGAEAGRGSWCVVRREG